MNLNLDTLRDGQGFILALEGRAETGQAHLAMLSQGLPAGWEGVDVCAAAGAAAAARPRHSATSNLTGVPP